MLTVDTIKGTPQDLDRMIGLILQPHVWQALDKRHQNFHSMVQLADELRAGKLSAWIAKDETGDLGLLYGWVRDRKGEGHIAFKRYSRTREAMEAIMAEAARAHDVDEIFSYVPLHCRWVRLFLLRYGFKPEASDRTFMCADGSECPVQRWALRLAV